MLFELLYALNIFYFRGSLEPLGHWFDKVQYMLSSDWLLLSLSTGLQFLQRCSSLKPAGQCLELPTASFHQQWPGRELPFPKSLYVHQYCLYNLFLSSVHLLFWWLESQKPVLLTSVTALWAAECSTQQTPKISLCFLAFLFHIAVLTELANLSVLKRKEI